MNWWWLIGLVGPLGLAALLRLSIDAYRDWNAKRRGPNLTFASREGVEALESVIIEFFPKVFGLNYHDCYISDESHLTDFEYDFPVEKTAQRIQTEFGVDVSTLPDQRLVTICEAIAKRGP